jgi:hypothetical protein
MASGVSAPSPSPGAEAAVVAKVRGAIQILQQAAASADPASEIGRAVYKAILDLGKVAPSGQSTAGMETTAQGNIAQDAKKKAMLMMLLQKAAQGQQSGAGAPAPGAPTPTPPSPEGD